MSAAHGRTWVCRALTDIWTGDADTAGTRRAERLVTTGLLGSIRWWFEVLVHGLGGSACDPTKDDSRCPDSRKQANRRGSSLRGLSVDAVRRPMELRERAPGYGSAP